MSSITFISLVLGLLPGLTWLWLYLKEETHPEPKWLVARTFIAGALSAFVALALQYGAKQWLTGGGVSHELVALGITTFVFAGIEEVCKFGAAFVSVKHSDAFRSPVDAMLFSIIAALGFATVENIAVAHGASLGGLTLSPVFQALTLRFVGATLVHSLASGIVGFTWGESLLRWNRSWGVLFGLFFATIVHGFFNLFILFYANLTYSLFFVAGAAVLVLIDFHKIKVDGRLAGV